ncbi:T9SS type A sorting domain-containing protein [Chryseobacterium sp. JJR-5R]|uniref:T9SS type A sorting domain-containing protein n=1 Tax=Chryseobacterium sp. JJR-5R TaxID=3093923 RepID=UPI002A74EF24|nr:T9SS type A sorting domain-containing protein [Chryseobacterium sp. JJR-5R]WPO81869.1 T9SS type A sorting domain-containing protein [Chryseobacterium sp. JJR-5R]
MKKLSIAAFCLSASFLMAQSYAPQVGTAGTTAISKDSPLFKSWASGCTVVRGLQQINGTAGTYANAGTDANGTGIANGSVVSLGDGGTGTVTFSKAIVNGSGFDFAIFENGFVSGSSGKAYLELAFVEVSSDGVNFFRFPSHNEYPADYIQNSTDAGGPGFATMDARYLNNFAGKYIGSYGTPFDLSDLPDNPLLDKSKITHIKIIDVVGTNADGYKTFDSFGNVAVDPFPTPFGSSGFDLDAVGVINEAAVLSAAESTVSDRKISIYPNPASDFIIINAKKEVAVKIYSISGALVKQGKTVNQRMNISDLQNGNYIVQIGSDGEQQNLKLIIAK